MNLNDFSKWLQYNKVKNVRGSEYFPYPLYVCVCVCVCVCVRQLVHSMPRRLVLSLKNHGGHTKY